MMRILAYDFTSNLAKIDKAGLFSTSRRSQIIALTAMVLASSALTSPAVAQSDGEGRRVASAADSGEIIVTARRREESVQSVPVSVSVLDSEVLDRNNINDLIDVAQNTPGFNVMMMARKDTTILQLRGQRSFDVRATQDAPVAIYFNDVVVTPQNGSNVGIYDLSSVQVLKGPQGTLFGRNTTGGAVLYTPVKPGEFLEGKVTAGYGRFNRKSLEGGVTVPLSEAASVRVSGRLVRSDGTGEIISGPLQGLDLGDEQSDSIRLSLVLRPTDSIENYTVGYFDHYRSNGPALHPEFLTGPALLYNGGPPFNLPDIQGQVAALVGRPYDTTSDIDSYVNTKAFGVNNTTTFDLGSTGLGNLTLKNIFGYRGVRSDALIDYDGTNIGLLDSAQNGKDFNQYSEELQLAGQTATADWVVGGYFYRLTGQDPADDVIALEFLNPANPFSSSGKLRNTSYSIYGEVTTDLSFLGDSDALSGLSLTLGARQSWDKRYMLVFSAFRVGTPDEVSAVPPALQNVPGGREVSGDFDAFTYNVTLDYKFDSGNMIFASHKKGYRSGGFNIGATNRLSQYDPFLPETLYQSELGIKTETDLGGGMFLRANLTGFYSTFKDIQRNVSQFDGATIATFILSGGSGDIKGVEGDMLFRPTDFLELSGFFSYIDTKYDDFSDAVANYSDNRFAWTPKWTASATARVFVPLGDSGTELNAQANYYYQSATSFDERTQSTATTLDGMPAFNPEWTPFLSQGGYGLANFRIGLENVGGNGMSVSAYLKNAFDKRYVGGGTVAAPSLGFISYIYGDPRTWGVDVSYRF